jgi:hypothetical protein
MAHLKRSELSIPNDPTDIFFNTIPVMVVPLTQGNHQSRIQMKRCVRLVINLLASGGLLGPTGDVLGMSRTATDVPDLKSHPRGAGRLQRRRLP